MQSNKYLRLHTIPRKYCEFFYRLGTSYAELSDHNRQANLNEDNLAIYYITLGTYCPQEIQVEDAAYLGIDNENIIEYKPATCKFSIMHVS